MREQPLRGRHPQRFGYIERVAELCETYEACPIVAEGLGLMACMSMTHLRAIICGGRREDREWSLLRL